MNYAIVELAASTYTLSIMDVKKAERLVYNNLYKSKSAGLDLKGEPCAQFELTIKK